MLPKKYRLSKSGEIKRVFTRGRFAQENGMRIKYILRGSGHPRFTFIVSKKTFKTAVARNKLKRRLRAIVAKRIPRIRRPYDAVFTFSHAPTNQFKELEAKVENLLYKAKIL